MICYSVSCGMPVFVTYLPYQKFSRLVAGNSYEDILFTTLTWGPPGWRLSLFRYWSRLSLFPLSDVWSLSCPNSKVCREDFPLFVFAVGDNTRTDLQIWRFQQTLLYWSCLCGNWLANFTLYRFLDEWIPWSKISNHANTRITNATGILLTF